MYIDTVQLLLAIKSFIDTLCLDKKLYLLKTLILKVVKFAYLLTTVHVSLYTYVPLYMCHCTRTYHCTCVTVHVLTTVHVSLYIITCSGLITSTTFEYI